MRGKSIILRDRLATDACRSPRGSALQLSSIPMEGVTITHLDLDLTAQCNLRCDYCFKEKSNNHMEVQTAYDAVVWLIYASGDVGEISLVFIGGEPLLRFKTIKELVPFAVRRAAQHGKRLRMSMTTNGTILNDEILAFCREWSIGFHTSIDGHPAVQDAHRAYSNGRGSSAVLERNLPRILSIWPNATARSTVVPDVVGEMFTSYLYFRRMGYREVAFVPGEPDAWDESHIAVFEQQLRKIADDVIRLFRAGEYVKVKYIDEICEVRGRGVDTRPGAACGAGRGMALVDVHGAFWPCHRWNRTAHTRSWRMGSLYDPCFDETARRQFRIVDDVATMECDTCPARIICGGGCPAENLEETGDIRKRHPNSCRLMSVAAAVGHTVFDVLSREHNALFLEQYPITHIKNGGSDHV